MLDSNVWLDILVFDDPRTRVLRSALLAKKVVAWISPACYAELVHVLEYPQFRRFSIDTGQVLEWVQTYSQLLQNEGKNFAHTLPVCKDRDDQKFLELAYQCDAGFLLSKDKALLKLAGRMKRQFNIIVLLPEVFGRQYLGSTALA